MKALIAARGIAPQKSHDLTTLLNDSTDAGWKVEQLRTHCDIVNPYSVAARYPGVQLDPTLVEARRSAAAGEEIVRLVKSMLGV